MCERRGNIANDLNINRAFAHNKESTVKKKEMTLKDVTQIAVLQLIHRLSKGINVEDTIEKLMAVEVLCISQGWDDLAFSAYDARNQYVQSMPMGVAK